MQIEDKIDLWRDLFYGRQDAFGSRPSPFTHKGAKYKCRLKDPKAKDPKEKFYPLTTDEIKMHIDGRIGLLIYPVFDKKLIRFCAIDFDDCHEFQDVIEVHEVLKELQVPHYMARSTKKGYHIYMFFDKPLDTLYVHNFIDKVYDESGVHMKAQTGEKPRPEFFPKQRTVDPHNTGNGICPPMQGQGLVRSRTCWIDENDQPIGGTGNTSSQWTYMATEIKKINVEKFVEFVKGNIKVKNIKVSQTAGAVEQLEYENRLTSYKPPKDGDIHKVLEGCPAFKDLMKRDLRKLKHMERVALMHMAIHTANGVEWLKETYNNHPEALKQINHAIATNQKPWSCRRLQEEGICKIGTHPKKKDHCFNSTPPMEVVDGELKRNPRRLRKDKWPQPSPIRLRTDIKYTAVKEEEEKHKKEKKKPVSERIAEAREVLREQGLVEKNGYFFGTDDSGIFEQQVDQRSGTISRKILLNFNLKIKTQTEIRKVEGESDTMVVLYADKFKRTMEMAAEDFSSNQKFAAALSRTFGCEAIFSTFEVDRLRIAVQALSENTFTKTMKYADFGYDNYTAPKEYRSSNCRVTAEEVEEVEGLVHTGADHTQYLRMKTLERDVLKYVSECLVDDILKIHKPDVTITAVAHALQASIHSAYLPLKKAPILWLQGITGSGKSTLANVCQAFYGMFPNLVSISSTYRAVEFLSMQFRDSLMVIDDYKGGDQKFRMIELLQQFYDRSGRNKMSPTNNYTDASRFYNRGLIMFTSEDKPTSEASTLARCILIDMPYLGDNSEEHDSRFSRADKASQFLSGLTAEFIKYVLNTKNKKDFEEDYYNIMGDLTLPGKLKQNSKRISANLAANFLTWKTFCGFLADEELIPRQKAEELISIHWSSIKSIQLKMVESCSEEQASNIFLYYIGAVLSSGKYCLENDKYIYPNATVIGFIDEAEDDDVVYFYPPNAYNAVKKYVKESGSNISHSIEAIGKQLKHDGVIDKCNKGRNQYLKSMDGSKRWTWCLRGEFIGYKQTLKLVQGGDISGVADPSKI